MGKSSSLGYVMATRKDSYFYITVERIKFPVHYKNIQYMYSRLKNKALHINCS